MKLRHIVYSLGLGLLIGCASTQESQFSQLPAAVRSTVIAQAGNAEVDSIAMENRGGRIAYNIAFRDPDTNPDLIVFDDGTLLQEGSQGSTLQPTGREGETPQRGPSTGTTWNESPQAVQETVKAEAGEAEIADIDKETRSGQVVYEISFKEEGKNPKIHVAADGSLVKSDLNGKEEAPTGASTTGESPSVAPGTDLSFENLPMDVRDAIKAEAGEAEIASITKAISGGKLVYVVTFQDASKNPAIQVAEDGTLVEGGTQDEKTLEPTGKPSGAPTPRESRQDSPPIGTQISDIPAPVRQAIQEKAPDAEISSISKEFREGRNVFEIKFKDESAHPTLRIAEDGSVVSGQ